MIDDIIHQVRNGELPEIEDLMYVKNYITHIELKLKRVTPVIENRLARLKGEPRKFTPEETAEILRDER